jgi:predicted phage terminase large subunit-like protein
LTDNKWVQREDCNYRRDYDAIFKDIRDGKIEEVPTMRWLCENDLFFLLVFGLGRTYANVPFIVNIIREFEDGPDTDTLDLWARGHLKSTIITFASVIQELIRDPDTTIGIFSHTRPIAKKFLRIIKATLEGTVPIKDWFPEVFFMNPRKEAPKWSEDDGIYVKRKTAAKEASIEAWGLVDGQPIGAHYKLRIYDDVIVKASVSTPEMIRKTAQAFEESESLGTEDGRMRMVGTHWHFADLYTEVRKGNYGSFHVRVKPIYDPETKLPVLFSEEKVQKIQSKQSRYVFSCQYLLQPVADDEREFNVENIRTFDARPAKLNKYILCDPASSKKKGSDKSAFIVVGIDEFGNRYVLDAVHDKLNLTERWNALKDLATKHKPIAGIGYEEYGLQADLEHFKVMERQEGVYLPRIKELGGHVSKEDRIRRLEPIIESGRLLVPIKGIVKKGQDVVEELKEQLRFFPYGKHDDFIDALSRLEDPEFRARNPVDIAGLGDNVISMLDRKIANSYDMV